MGVPYDSNMHQQTALHALKLVDNADRPGSVFESQFTWSESEAWKDNYGQITADNQAELIEMGKQNRQRRRDNRAQGLFRE
jgi:hypothetical protein